MGESPEKRPHFVINFLSGARGVFHKERNTTSIVKDVWENVTDISDQIFYKYYSRDNPPILNQSLSLLLNVALEEAVFYRYYNGEGKANETLKEKTKPLPTVVFSEFENRFGNYKSKIYNSILQGLGTTDVQVMASLIYFYRSEVFPKAEDIVTNYKGHKLYRLGADVVRGQMAESVLELLPRMKSIEASVRKS